MAQPSDTIWKISVILQNIMSTLLHNEEFSDSTIFTKRTGHVTKFVSLSLVFT